MATYSLVWIYYGSSSSGTQVFSSRPSVLQDVIAEVKRVVPSAKVEFRFRSDFCILETEHHLLDISELNKQGAAVAWHLIDFLTSKGWEPFADSGAMVSLRYTSD